MVAVMFKILLQTLKVAAKVLGIQARERRAHPDDGRTRVFRRAHIGGAGQAAAADDGFISDLPQFPDALEGCGQHPLPRHAPDAVAQHRHVVGFGITRPDSVNGAESVRPRRQCGLANFGNVRHVWRQLWNHWLGHRLLNRADNLRHDLRVLPHGHAVATGVGAGQVQLEAIRHRCQYFGHGDELFHAATEDGYQ